MIQTIQETHSYLLSRSGVCHATERQATDNLFMAVDVPLDRPFLDGLYFSSLPVRRTVRQCQLVRGLAVSCSDDRALPASAGQNKQFVQDWLIRSDAQRYMILGDPAASVRLSAR
jgi:hypothetical protein